MNATNPPELALPRELPALLRRAYDRLTRRLGALAPALARELVPWMEERVAKGTPPERYFTHPIAFPLVLLPWWLDESLGTVDVALQEELLYSSIAGYYAIRLIDDVMDRTEGAAVDLLPAALVLQAEFQAPYVELFAATHPFWRVLHEAWAGAHQAAVEETRLVDLDEAAFQRVSARKVSAALIPLSAVALRCGHGELPPPWPALFATMCSFHQRYNDVFDWKRDLDAGSVTWFLSEGRRRRRSSEGESMMGWVAREGFALAVDDLERELAEMAALARASRLASVDAWIETRRRLLDAVASDARAGLRAVAPLLAALESRQVGA